MAKRTLKVAHPAPSATRVIFRNWGDANAGDIVAILLDVPANPGHVVCFEHVGQHAEGRYSAVMGNTHSAAPEEYAALKRELEAPPYNYTLLVRKRRSIQGSGDWRKRWARRN